MRTIKDFLMKIAAFFNRLFVSQPEEPESPFVYGLQCFLSFAINRYSQSPLKGCINDQIDIWARIKLIWTGFVARLFQDSKCTWQKFEEEMRAAFAAMPKGILVVQYSGHGTYTHDPAEGDGYSEALYFYNGAYSDDKLYKLMQEKPPELKVVFLLDCCFSTGITNPRILREKPPVNIRYRYLASEPMPLDFKVNRKITYEPLDWVVFAACGERETAADAFMLGRNNGIFSFYLKQIMHKGVFYTNWQREIDKYLPSASFNQSPTLGGKEGLVNTLALEV